jgi:tetratricopeptide (TPR) repeat protein
MLGVEGLPEPFVRRVYDETLGNPFFIEAVLHSLVERGAVYLEQGAWAAAADVGALEIPRRMGETFLRRAGLLGEVTRDVLDLIAVSGRPVSLQVLQEAVGRGPEEVHEALVELFKRRMIRQLTGQAVVYNIEHDRMREALCASMEPARRRGRHGRLAGAIERLFAADLPGHYFELAQHYWQAEDREKAWHYCRLGATRAKETHANDIGVELCERALELLPEAERSPDGAVRLELTEMLADMACLVGDYDRSAAAYEEVFAAARTDVDKARLWRKRGHVFYEKGDLPASEDCYWRCVETLGHRRPRGLLRFATASALAFSRHLLAHVLPRVFVREARTEEGRQRARELAWAYVRLGLIFVWTGPNKMLLTVFRAVNAAQRGGDSDALSYSYSFLGFLYAGLTLFGMSKRYLDRGAAVAERIGSTLHTATARSYAGIRPMFMGNWEESVRTCREAMDLLDKCGDISELGIANAHRIYSLCYLGRFEEAGVAAQSGLRLLERSKNMIVARTHYYLLARVKGYRGEFAEALALCESVTKMAAEKRDFLMLCKSHMEWGQSHLNAGDLDAAIVQLENAERVRRQAWLLLDYAIRLLPILASAYLGKLMARGDSLPADERRRMVRRAGQVVRQGLWLSVLHPTFRAPALAQKARWEYLRGRSRRGARYFERARAYAHERGARQQLGDVYAEAAECLLRYEPEARSRADEYLQEALALYEGCGARALADRTRAVIANLPA